MRLSKIKLSGFKSFVDPTTISFPSNLIGVVGPNGCGKSNIIDAVRWVLGESSAKTLRGDSMADVIFNGSSGRKPVGQASIELLFDNSDGKISGPYAGYAEVAVRRVVARDGTSQYFLNNGRCRRKDITHLLLGTGVGSHGYSIIEQGMISRLVEAKPEELRAFLEEAAGISKYKERRRETEHRIRHTRDNLDRLGDLRDELDQQLQHLQRQAKAAERYKVLKGEERRVQAELLALRLAGLRANVADEERFLATKQLALEAAVTAQRAVEAQIEKLRVELGERSEAFNGVQGVYYRVGSEIARLEQSIKHRKETIKRHEGDLAETDAQLAEITGHIENDSVELEQLDRLLSKLHPDLEEAASRTRQSEQALKDAEQEMERVRDRWEQISQDTADTHRTVQVEEARIEQLGAQRERLEKTREAQRAERETLSFEGLEAELETLIKAEERERGASAEAARAVAAVYERIQRLRAEEDEVAAELDTLRETLQSDRGRLSSLEALQEAALGTISSQVEAWLKRHKLAAKRKLAESLQVEPGWERAAETALRGYLQAIDVDALDPLAADLAALEEGGLTLYEPGLSPSAKSRGKSTPKGGLSPLADQIKAPAAAKSLVAGVYTAPSLRKALKSRAALSPGESILTPEGLWITATSVRVAASDDPQVGVLERAEEIERLTDAVATAAAEAESLAARHAEAREQLESLEEQRDALQLEANDTQHTYAQTQTRLESARAKLDEARRRAAALDRSLAELDDDADRIERATADSRRKLELAAGHREELGGERARLDREREQQHERVTDARWTAEQDREHMQEIAIKVESRRSSMESATAALARVQSQQQHLLKRRHELDALTRDVSSPLAGEEEALVAKLDERLTVEENLTAARTAVEQCDAAVRNAEGERTEKQRAVDEAREHAEAVRLSAREVQVRAETVAEQFQATGFELEPLVADLPDDASVETWSETLERIDRRIQRLGAINLAAIDEFTEKSERKQYLDTQFEDLTSALDTLESAIRKIDRETRARFRETFENANAGLTRLFPRLFGGGEAYLELESDDLLSAGVTIMARPPGKKISTIHLLSGGEKALTAVALVFSIFEMNPAPFCLLDEVDAPLDDANVGRFSEIVKEMSAQVQFILITHNKTTMEVMHQLAGVTMQEPGVSRLVAVDIDEAVQLAAM